MLEWHPVPLHFHLRKEIFTKFSDQLFVGAHRTFAGFNFHTNISIY